ncbi:hypothetical protein [Paenibacillus sp. FSL H8-0034]|uniref:hypothetical protein n=1 Tax=Paenibacillus sp. FSL H8-0034 TaxID=2954671 RepID=UPI0030F5B15D
MSINSKLSDLYHQYIKPDEHFVAGGVVDEADYENANVKVLMLFKEVNDKGQKENWSLVDLIQQQLNDQSFLPMWKRVGEWNCGLQVGFPQYSTASYNMNLGLQWLATTNLKKSGGGGQSNYAVIREHAINNVVLWTSEIEIMKPELVICGGTFEIVKEVLGLHTTVSPSGKQVGKALSTTFVQFYHPMYRISPNVLYSHFKETMIGLGYGK